MFCLHVTGYVLPFFLSMIKNFMFGFMNHAASLTGYQGKNYQNKSRNTSFSGY